MYFHWVRRYLGTQTCILQWLLPVCRSTYRSMPGEHVTWKRNLPSKMGYLHARVTCFEFGLVDTGFINACYNEAWVNLSQRDFSESMHNGQRTGTSARYCTCE
ncbi:hypothetical protein F5Y11DRAFT_1140 [Daldinia sp. FL1419]|nr:hypothetical protein F5Y11DRAFT_1140 [Daldinia sp. FL1419]